MIAQESKTIRSTGGKTTLRNSKEAEADLDDLKVPDFKMSRMHGLLNKVALLVILVLGVIYLAKYFIDYYEEKSIHQYPSDKWQAVFLDNGQVYFGHVTKVTKNSVVLNNIYYLQIVNRPLQQSQITGAEQQPEQRLTLIKLGNEIHGPVDQLNINREHVMFIENLKEGTESRVVGAIDRYIEDLSAEGQTIE